MIVVLEGPDGAGKTTLAHWLVREFNLGYHHESVPPIDVPPLVHYGRVLEGLRGENVVIDRLALGERVYGPIVRGQDRLGADGWVIFQRLLRAVDAIEIICLPPVQVALDNWRSRHETELFTEEIKFLRAYAEYGYYASRWHLWQSFDYTTTSYEELTYGWDAPDDRRPTLPCGMVGSPWARVLIVGERGSGATHDIDLPFWGTDGSSGYLLAALNAAGLSEYELAFINAQRIDGGWNTPPRLNSRGELWRVIALGDVAQAWCARLGLADVRKVPHPQFWKRFHHADMAGYARLLRDAAGENAS